MENTKFLFEINKSLIGVILSLLSVNIYAAGTNVGTDFAQRVNILMGTKGDGLKSGYIFAGATYPHGMVQFTPTYFCKEAGFVINQMSGGGCEHMGNFPTLPLKGKLNSSPNMIRDMQVNISEEKGHAGYYRAKVQDG